MYKSDSEANRLLNLMDYKEFNTLEKDRLVYAYKEYKVVIDDIKGFRVGVEIEKMTNKRTEAEIGKIKAVADELGINVLASLTDTSVTFMYMQKNSRF